MSKISLINDRYSGRYSGAKWTAWIGEEPEEINADDVTCSNYWYNKENIPPHGEGESPGGALEDLWIYFDLNDYTPNLRK